MVTWCMPRTARASIGGICYHVLNRGNARRMCFTRMTTTSGSSNLSKRPVHVLRPRGRPRTEAKKLNVPFSLEHIFPSRKSLSYAGRGFVIARSKATKQSRVSEHTLRVEICFASLAMTGRSRARDGRPRVMHPLYQPLVMGIPLLAMTLFGRS